MNVPGDER